MMRQFKTTLFILFALNSSSGVFGRVILSPPVNLQIESIAKNLDTKRYDVLVRDYLPKPFDKGFVADAIEGYTPDIDTQIMYQCLIDDSKSKFIAFFMEDMAGQDFIEHKERHHDKGITIYSDEQNLALNIAQATPESYSYILYGVKSNGKWYFSKSYATYFDKKSLEEGRKVYFFNLANWGFFKEKSTEFSPDFWTTHLFEKVEFEGIQQYYVVKTWIERERREGNDIFRAQTGAGIFQPFYDSLKVNNPDEFNSYSIMYDKFTLIFPSARNVIINPILITDKSNNQRIRYFVYIPADSSFYEWTYFQPKPRVETGWHYGSEIVKNLSDISTWNFSYDTFDDNNFWEKYVLYKENGEYKYLKRIK